MTGHEHYREAERLIPFNTEAAQVHATLALAASMVLAMSDMIQSTGSEAGLAQLETWAKEVAGIDDGENGVH